MKTAIVVLLAAVWAGCSVVEEPSSNASNANPLNGTVSGGAAKYLHAFSHSHFAIGGTTTNKTELGRQKVVGPWGVFATHVKTGMTLALPNADAPSRKAPPYPGGSPAHDAAVKAYFLGGGLPSEQIEGVQVMTSVTGVAPPTDAEALPPPKLEAYFSKITRQVQGIPVAESFAWARINDKGEVVMESVYWPEIPSTVVARATAFAKNIADSTWNSSFMAKLPNTPGRLTIHHTPGTWEGAFEATVAFDVPRVGGRVLHFDENGVGFELPDEKPGSWGYTPSQTK
ncbi:MAG: hypothetical protein AMXMBFR58_37900 [Phycisphaerae bacterium]